MGIEAPRIQWLQKVAGLLWVAVLLVSCAAPVNDNTTDLGRQAIIDETNRDLDNGDCVSAVKEIQPLYNSANTDNRTRMIMASAWACHAQLNFFGFLDSLTQNGSGLANGALWSFLTLSFPSALGKDYMAEGSDLGIDATMAVLNSGIPILPANLFNLGNNPESILLTDRTNDANAYLTFLAMAAIGSYQSRYGNPFPNGKKGPAGLPWTSAGAVDSNGCAYASAILNMVDSMGALATASTGLNSSITQIQSAFQLTIHDACDKGCQNQAPLPGWVNSGCTTITPCTACPAMLHDRNACTGLVSDQVSCAASGIVNFINVHPLGWQTGP